MMLFEGWARTNYVNSTHKVVEYLAINICH